MNHPRLLMANIVKHFGPTTALAGVDLELNAGEIHAIVGENGAGKSTLMAVLSGAISPDAGTMYLDGSPYRPVDPREARQRGVAIVHQELSLLPHLSVEANVVLGVEAHRWSFLRHRVNRTRVRSILAELERSEIDPSTPIEQLSMADRQIVEIARGLLLDVKVLILDEPTAALNQNDVAKLFLLMRRLRDRGVSVVFISHFLEEVEAIADRFTVLRDGKRIISGDRSKFSQKFVIEQMLGRRFDEQFPRVAHERGEPILHLHDVSLFRGPQNISLTLHRGEILGLAGLVGAGRTEVLRAIYGLDLVRSGQIQVGVFSSAPTDPASQIERGIGFLSEDRKNEGLALTQSIQDNVTLSRLQLHVNYGFLRVESLRHAARSCLSRMQVLYRDLEQAVGTLSGGNQQKVALARLMHQGADIWLMDEPTKGIDIASKAEIYRQIGELAAQGKAILMVSNYLPELLGICDRIAAMHRGRIVAVRETKKWSQSELLAAIVAGTSGAEATFTTNAGE
jgi:ribose transport system ATP-binding protein